MRNDVSPMAFGRLFRLCCRLRPEIVLLCNQRAARLAAPAARLAGVAAVVMRNGLEGSFGDKRWNRWLARTCISDFVVNAEALRRELLSYGWVAPERVTVIYNGIDPAASAPRRSREAVREELRARSEIPILLCAARLADDKGQEDLIRAVASLQPVHPDLRVLIVGEGSRRPALEALVAAAGLGAQIQFLGFRSDVPDLLGAADVVVIPSYREGVPNIALEAMAAGRPVVATAVSGTPEAVIDGETGLLVPPGQPDALAGALARILADPVEARSMGERGKARVQARFRADTALANWEQYLSARRAPARGASGRASPEARRRGAGA
jgi:glycosyltransferase involved in cell wall biosynthesis